MTLFVERRRLERFQVPNALVKYKSEPRFTDRIPVEGQGELVDLTTKGVRFESEDELNSGVRLNIEIIIPNEEPITLIGNVVWTKKLDKNGMINSVIEFIEFDDEPGYNSFESLDRLETLQRQYSDF
ncbi:MAG: PilZ domain-containing protein [Calditrichaceae bacterium]|jgi:hypothetical protein